MALEQLKDVLDAYAQHDTEAAMDVWRRDDAIDALHTSMFRELLTFMMEDPRNITFCTHLLFCAKNIERVGDHTTNVAETIYYLVTGQSAQRRTAERRSHQHDGPGRRAAAGWNPRGEPREDSQHFDR